MEVKLSPGSNEEAAPPGFVPQDSRYGLELRYRRDENSTYTWLKMRCEPPPLNLGSFLVLHETKVVAEGTVTRYLNGGENSTALDGKLNSFSIGSKMLMQNILVPNTTVHLSVSGSAERILTGKPGEWKAEFTGSLVEPAFLTDFISILTGTASIKMHRVIYPDDSSRWTMSELSLATDARFGRRDGTGFSAQAKAELDLYGSRTDRSYFLRTAFMTTVSDVGLNISPTGSSGRRINPSRSSSCA